MEKNKRFLKPSKKSLALKELEKIIENLKKEVIIIEGKRDLEAFKKIGIENSYQIVGRENSVYLKLKEKNVKKVVMLTDLDRKGNQLAKRVGENLWGMGIIVDYSTRKKLGKILRIKYFEDFERKYKEFTNER